MARALANAVLTHVEASAPSVLSSSVTQTQRP
jgi:hypothetical protein